MTPAVTPGRCAWLHPSGVHVTPERRTCNIRAQPTCVRTLHPSGVHVTPERNPPASARNGRAPPAAPPAAA
eukprot:1031215-Prorocentrum_minimum.AAC.1